LGSGSNRTFYSRDGTAPATPAPEPEPMGDAEPPPEAGLATTEPAAHLATTEAGGARMRIALIAPPLLPRAAAVLPVDESVVDQLAPWVPRWLGTTCCLTRPGDSTCPVPRTRYEQTKAAVPARRRRHPTHLRLAAIVGVPTSKRCNESTALTEDWRLKLMRVWMWPTALFSGQETWRDLTAWPVDGDVEQEVGGRVDHRASTHSGVESVETARSRGPCRGLGGSPAVVGPPGRG
jgi:hypothetical protein